MSTYNTPNLGISLPTPGTSEPFSVSGINADFETIDTWAGGIEDDIASEASTRAAADTALDGRIDTLEAGPTIFVQSSDPTSGMVTGDLRFW